MRCLCKVWIVGLILATLGFAPANAQDVIALEGATLVDAGFDEPIENGVILIRDGRISALGSAGTVDIPAGVERVDLSGRWIMPGLVDSHMHFAQSGSLYTRPDGLDLRDVRSYESDRAHSAAELENTFGRYLASGVTAVVDVGGPASGFVIRDERQSGDIAPRIAMAGPLLATLTEGFAGRVARLDLGDDPMMIRVQGPDRAREYTREQLKARPDLIKIWYINSDERPAASSYATVKAIIDEAHKGGVRVAVHATELQTAQLALQAGADILVHAVDDKPVDQNFITAMKQNNAIIMTTATVYEHIGQLRSRKVVLTPIEKELGDPAVIASWAETPEESKRIEIGDALDARVDLILANLKVLADAGIPVAVGTDAGNPGTLHGPSIHRELELLEAAGLSMEQILRAATIDAASVFAKEPDFGALEVGKLADLLILKADPTKNVAAWQEIETVVLGGVRHDPAALAPFSPAALVQRQLEAYNAHDLEAFAATYAEDVELFNLPAAGTPTRQGRETLKEVYKTLFEEQKPNCRLLSRVVQGDYIIDQEFCRFGDNGLIRASAIYQVEDELIRRVWFAR